MMDIENGTMEYVLKTPIMVHFAGEGEKEVISLELREPMREHAAKAVKLKQMIMRAFMEFSEKRTDTVGIESSPIHETSSEDAEKNGEEMRLALRTSLLMSEKVDLGVFLDTFCAMASKQSKKPIILCDGNVPLKDVHFEGLPADEIENLAFTYCAFFTMPSME